MIHMLSIVTEFMLIRRVDTLRVAVMLGLTNRVAWIVDFTIDTIAQCSSSEVNEKTLAAYIKTLEMVKLLMYLGVPKQAMIYADQATDIVDSKLGEMTGAYMMCNRMKTPDTNTLGTLYVLPNEIITHIGSLIMCK